MMKSGDFFLGSRTRDSANRRLALNHSATVACIRSDTTWFSITCDGTSCGTNRIYTSGRVVIPSTQSNLFPKLICLLYVETHKVSTSIRGRFHVSQHKTFHEQVHSARLSCTADARPLNWFENGPNLAKNRIEYGLLTT